MDGLCLKSFLVQDEPLSAVQDRALRISRNTGQQSLDQVCGYSGAAMALVGAIGFRINPVVGMAQGGGLGIAMGVIIYFAYSKLADQRI